MNQVPRWRRIVGAFLVVVGCLLVPLSLSAVWVRNTLLDTDNYVSTVGPLASNPDIQKALATDLTNAIFTRGDVNQRIEDALPSGAGVLAAPIASAVQNATEAAALRLFESDRFATLWENANARAHPRVVAVLTGGGPRVSTEDGTIAINTEQIFENVKARLDAKGITLLDDATLPESKQQFVLFQSKTLADAQGLVDLLQKLAWFLPVLALAGFAGGIGLSGRRRRTVLRATLGVALAVALQLVLLKTGRDLYLNAVTSKKLPEGAAGAVWDQLTSMLRTSGITVVVLALIVAAAAWIAGPGPAPTQFRAWWRRALGTSSNDADAHPPSALAAFVARSTSLLRGIGVAIALLVLILWKHPTALTVLGVAVLLVVYLVVVELIGRSARPQVAADEMRSDVSE